MGPILVGFDGSPAARRALDHAARRATASGDEIVILTVIPASVRESSLGSLLPAGLERPAQMTRSFEANALLRIEEISETLRKAGAKARAEVRAGEAPVELLKFADEVQAHEIVIGHKAFEGPRLLLGKNAEGILRGAKVPVTVVP